MKIAMLGSGSLRSSLSFRIVALGEQLVRHGWDVSLVLPSADKYNNYRREDVQSFGGMRIIQPLQPSTRHTLLNLAVYIITANITILRQRYDAIYLYKPTPITVVGLLPHMLRHTPVILDLDDLGSEVMRSEGRPAFEWRLVAACERLALRYATKVIVTSTFLQRRVQRLAPNTPVTIIPNGVNASDYQPDMSAQPRNHIFYFGAINRLSLIEPLIKAMPAIIQAVPDVKLTIIGGGSALKEAQLLASQVKISPATTFTGWTDMYQAASFTQAGDIAVCYQPDIDTVRAASNMKVFQYMAMGAVPVVSRVGDLPHYVADGRGVVAGVDDPNGLASAIIKLMHDPAQRRTIAHSARQAAETTYSWSTLARNVMTFVNTPTPVRGKRGV